MPRQQLLPGHSVADPRPVEQLFGVGLLRRVHRVLPYTGFCETTRKGDRSIQKNWKMILLAMMIVVNMPVWQWCEASRQHQGEADRGDGGSSDRPPNADDGPVESHQPR
jgi:hypothetical protein